MKKLLTLIVLIVVFGAAWYLASPLFFDDVVNETFPTASIDDDMEMMKNLTVEDVQTLPVNEQIALQRKMDDVGAAMSDSIVEDAMPTGPTAIAAGTFVGADSFHQGSGQATFYNLEDGQQVLRFEDFTVTNGPALHVYLVKAADGNVDSGFVDLGSLKGNKGNQNYNLPSNVSAEDYKSVVIWCKPFAVTFATAELV